MMIAQTAEVPGQTSGTGSFLKIPVNANAPVYAEGNTEIHAPVALVWEVLSSINEWNNWHKGITDATLHGELREGSTFKWKADGIKVNSVLHTVQPFSNLGWSGKAFGMSAIHNWTLTGNHNLTHVAVSESMEGMLAALLQHVMKEKLRNGMDAWLAFLKAECENRVKDSNVSGF